MKRHDKTKRLQMIKRKIMMAGNAGTAYTLLENQRTAIQCTTDRERHLSMTESGGAWI